MAKLEKWKDNPDRMPLILQGARQVGKTWLMQEFGRRFFDHVAYFIFEKSSILSETFKADMNVSRILETLSILSGKKITQETLIVFDEIQECPEAVTFLKYFCEQRPGHHLIAAGSYLGISEHRGLSFPVGKVNFLTLRPLDFLEFLRAMGEELACDAIEGKNFDVLRPLHDTLIMWVKKYLYIGGMPKAVLDYQAHGDFARVREIQDEILMAYAKDFSKHIPASDLPKVKLLWRSLPSQLAKENKKFVYGAVKPGGRAREYENAISWLCSCGLVHQIHRVKKPAFPLCAYEDLAAFKLFLVDVGLLAALSRLNVKIILEKTSVFEEFKGALAEQFVLQQLKASERDMDVYYWSNDVSTNEIDFLVQSEDEIIPVEVKAGINLQSKSLSAFISKFHTVKALRFSSATYKANEVIRDIPLYAVGDLHD